MKKKITLGNLVALDNALDTMVFGRPLGLFGEKIMEEPKVEVKAEEPKKNPLTDLVALDNALDTMVFGKPLGLFGENATEEDIAKVKEMFGAVTEPTAKAEEPKPTTSTIIGKRYKVFDNSYARCKTYGTDACGLNGKVYEIVSEPYKSRVKSILNETCEEVMIDVKSLDTDLVYSVLFMENGLMANDTMSYRDVEDAKRPKPRF